MKDYIGKSIRLALLAVAIIVGLSGSVAAMDPIKFILFWGGGSSAPAPMVTTLSDIDGNDVADIDGNQIGTL